MGGAATKQNPTGVSATSKATSSQGVDDRGTEETGTGLVSYVYQVEVDAVRRKLESSPIGLSDKTVDKGVEKQRFHYAVFQVLFGRELPVQRFLAHFDDSFYRAWASPGTFLDRQDFSYKVHKYAQDQLRVMPTQFPIATYVGRVKVNTDPGVSKYAFKAAADFHKLDQPLQAIFESKLGVRITDPTVWKNDPMWGPIYAESCRRIVRMLNDIDTTAELELLADLDKATRRVVGPGQFNLARILDFEERLKGLVKETQLRQRQAEYTDIDFRLDAGDLLGCGELYFLLKQYNASYPYAPDPGVIDPKTGKQVILLPRAEPVRINPWSEESRTNPRAPVRQHRTPFLTSVDPRGKRIAQLRLEKEIFKEGAFKKRQNAFVDDFERRAALFARNQLKQHLRHLTYYRKRTNIEALNGRVSSAFANSLARVLSDADLSSWDTAISAWKETKKTLKGLEEEFPIVGFINFWELYHDSIRNNNPVFNPKGEEKFSAGWLRILMSRTEAAIRNQLKELDDSDYVWKAEITVDAALSYLGLMGVRGREQTDNDMYTDLVDRKRRREARKDALVDFALMVLTIALSLTGNVALVAGGIVLQIVDVYRMIDNKAMITERNMAGLSDESPPSDFWILLAVAGTGADVRGIMTSVKLFGSRSVREANEQIDQIVAKLRQTSDTAALAVERARVAKESYEIALKELDDARLIGKSLRDSAPELANVAKSLIGLRIRRFEHFVLELWRKGAIRKVTGAPLNDDFKAIMQRLTKDEKAFLRENYLKALSGHRQNMMQLDHLTRNLDEASSEVIEKKNAAANMWNNELRKGKRDDAWHRKKAEHTKLKNEEAAARQEELGWKAQKVRLDDSMYLTDDEWYDLAEQYISRHKGWEALDNRWTPAVDGIRGAPGQIQVQQTKSIKTDSISGLFSSCQSAIYVTRKKYRETWGKLQREFNDGTMQKGADHFGFEMPSAWNDPSIAHTLYIPVITDQVFDKAKLIADLQPTIRRHFGDVPVHLDIVPVSPAGLLDYTVKEMWSPVISNAGTASAVQQATDNR